MYVVVVGCGRVGSAIAHCLAQKGYQVAIVDKNASSFRHLPPGFAGLTFTGDGAEPEVLEQVEVQRAQLVVACTDNDNVNIMVAELARGIYQVPRVVARINDPAREKVFHGFGLETVCPTTLTANAVVEMVEKGV